MKLPLSLGLVLSLTLTSMAQPMYVGRFSGSANLTGLSVSNASGCVTNNGVIWYVTNNIPSLALPNGSFATRTDVAQFYFRTNSTWVILAGSGGGSGSVTSVAITAPSLFNVSGSPVTGAGTIGLSFANQTANTFLAGPTSGSPGAVTMRSITATDIPALTLAKISDAGSIASHTANDYQATNATLTQWQAIAPASKQDQSANLDAWSLLNTNQVASSNAATTGTLGLVQPDGATITINPATGVISAQTGGSGDVSGPASATGDNFVTFNGSSGKSIKDSLLNAGSFQATNDNLTLWQAHTPSEYQTTLGFTAENVANKSTSTSLGSSDTLFPSQNAVKQYVDTRTASLLNNSGVTSGILKSDGLGGVAASTSGDVTTLFSGSGGYLKSDGTRGDPAGSGDVTQVGQNNFTGSNWFGGAVRVSTNLIADSFSGGSASVTGAVAAASFTTTGVLSGFVGPNDSLLISNITTGRFLLFTNGNFSGVFGIPSTNISSSAAVLSPASNQTNYTIPLLPGPSGNPLTIYTANTNCYFTLTGTNNPDWQRTVLLRGWTNSINITVTFSQMMRTNSTFNAVLTNGFLKVIHFYNTDGTGTNILVTDGGRWQ